MSLCAVQGSDGKCTDSFRLSHFPLPLLNKVFKRLDPTAKGNLYLACKGTVAAQRIAQFSSILFEELRLKRELSLGVLRQFQEALALYGESIDMPTVLNAYCQEVRVLDLGGEEPDVQREGEALHCLERAWMHNLTTLSLSRVKGFSRTHVERLVSYFPKLETLTFDTYMQDDVLTHLVARLGNRIKVLNLTRCAEVTDQSVKAIAMYCKTLQKLNVSDCPQITDQGIGVLCKRLPPRFDMLNLNGCHGIKKQRTLIELAKRISLFIPVRGSLDSTACLEIYGLGTMIGLLKAGKINIHMVHLLFHGLPQQKSRDNVARHMVRLASAQGIDTDRKDFGRLAFLGEPGMNISNQLRIEALNAMIETEYRFGLESS